MPNKEASETRGAVVELAKSWLGKKESDGSYKTIIDTYNGYQGELPRQLKMQYSQPWCACTWSALAVKLGYTNIMPIEISCGKLIEAAKKLDCWVEDDAYIPDPGDGILYDWGDTGKGDNTGWPDHIGVVETVNRTAGTLTVIEGNYNNAVRRRTIGINARYIRGYITPRYDLEKGETKTGGVCKMLQWVGEVTASSLNVRSWAGTEYPNIKSWPYLKKGNLIDVCDTVTAKDGAVWYYIRIASKYYGFVHSRYIARH